MKLKNLLYSVTAGVVMLLAACTPDKDSLGAVDVTAAQLSEGSGFTVSVDQTTNQVTFTSKMPSSYSVYWEYGPKPAEGADPAISGTSTNNTYQLGIAFDGDYYVRMGVQTRGGIVFSDRAIFHIDNMNTDLLSDPLWTLLTGGIGKSKTWVLDIDANGTALMYGGPIWFFTSGYKWDNLHTAKGANYIDSKKWDAKEAIEPYLADDGTGQWYWKADWAGNTWMCDAADYGEMTFALVGGANVDVNGEKGAFNMDVDNHTISFTGTVALNTGNHDVAAQCPSGTYKILHLTENALQILFDGDNETPFTLNYISKDYKENYVPEVKINNDMPVDFMDYIQPKNQFITTYKFDESEPYAYFSLAGEKLAGRTIYPAHADLGDAELELTSNTGKFKITSCDGNVGEGKYSLSKGDPTFIKATETASWVQALSTIISDSTYVMRGAGLFSFDNLPTFAISTNSDVNFGNDKNELQILQYEIDDRTGDITELWLGSKQYDAQGEAYEYLAYHFIKQTGGAQVESFTGQLWVRDSNGSELFTGETFVTGEGSYTFTIQGDGSNAGCIYLDILKLVKKYPNADIIVTSVKVDGNEMFGKYDFLTDEVIARGTADGNGIDGRRYFINPWDTRSDAEKAEQAAILQFKSKFEVTVTVKYDTGEPKLQ